MRLAYDVYAPPQNTEEHLSPIILLHGMSDSRMTWKFIAADIAKRTGRKVYAVDARNHGESPWSDEFSFEILADDLDDFLTQHNIPKAVLVGHSMGGRTSLILALNKPEKVEKLVIEDIHTKGFTLMQLVPVMYFLKILIETVKIIPSDITEMEAKQIAIEFMKSQLGENEATQLAKLDMSMIALEKRNNAFVWQANLKAIENFLRTGNIHKSLQGIYLGDSLFLYGTKSFFNVDKDPGILKCFPRSIKLGFEGGTHIIHFEDPEKFVEAVTNFINGDNCLKSKY